MSIKPTLLHVGLSGDILGDHGYSDILNGKNEHDLMKTGHEMPPLVKCFNMGSFKKCFADLLGFTL